MAKRDPQTQQWLEAIRDNQLSRRQLIKRGAALGLAVPAVSTLLAACDPDDEDDEVVDDPVVDDDEEDDPPAADPDPDDDEEEDVDVDPDDEDDDEPVDVDDDEVDDDVDEEDRYGGSLYLAQIGEPPTLDIHLSTASATAINAWQMIEPLFTWDEDLELMMDLAEDFEVSDDGLTNTVYLREGVNFHNGDVMTAEDVLASIERWSDLSGLGGDLMETVDNVEIIDDHTLEFQMNAQLGAFTTMLARQNQGCGIYPASVIEEAGEADAPELIGTGPFMFVEQVADQHVHYERFEDYSERTDEPSGYGGRKTAYLDEMFFVPVPDEASRIAGLQAGDYHYLESIIADHFETLEADDTVVAELLPPTSWGCLVVNHAEGIMSDPAMRQAMQAALDHEEMATAGYGAPDYFRLDPSLMFEETAWHSTVGEELFSPNDPDRAAELAEEAGYNGEPIRILATQEYIEYYNFAILAEQQLEDAGFDVEVTVVDWATLTEQREDPGAWDLYTTAMAFRIDPVGLPFMMGTTWPGWWDSDRKVELTEQLQQEIDIDERMEIWEEVQELFYEEVPLIKIADQFDLNARSPQIQGFEPFVQLSPFFWNVWLDE